MFSPSSVLPNEVWTQVLGHLCPADRLRVRLVCTHFRDLVDNSGLWRHWTVTLRSDKYNKQFWCMLRRWRVSSVALSSPRGWTHISTELPQLTTVIIDHDSGVDMGSLQCFSNLKRVYLRRPKSMPFDKLLPLLPPQLMHLSVCEFQHKGRSFVNCFRNVLNFGTPTHLINLRSLVCHCSFPMEADLVLPTILSALPQLKHLSLLGPLILSFRLREQPSLQHHSLSSLEIIESVYDLPDNTMKMVPSLRCLALCYSQSYIVAEHMAIGFWLRDLSSLSSLLIVGGPPVRHFVRSIPPSVTHLTLRPLNISTSEMTELSERLPNLRHLHLEPCVFLGPETALLPRLFPGLRSLRVRHERVSEEAFLSLASLKELQLLETQDPVPPSVALISKIRDLTKNRLRISQRPERNRLQTCYCARHLLTENWAKVWD